MKTMEIYSKNERFFYKNSTGDEWTSWVCQQGFELKPLSPPLLPQHPWKGILPDFDEDDGEERQKWFLEEFDWGWMDVIDVQAGGREKPPSPPPTTLKRDFTRFWWRRWRWTVKMNDFFTRIRLRDEWTSWVCQQGFGGKPPSPPLLLQHPWKGILPDFDENGRDERKRWTIF